MIKVKRALISVSDKTGLLDFAKSFERPAHTSQFGTGLFMKKPVEKIIGLSLMALHRTQPKERLLYLGEMQ